MAIPGAAAASTFTQAAQAVAVLVQADGFGGGFARVQQAAFFDGQEEDEPVNQAQQLLEVIGGREFAACQTLAQRVVGAGGQEALTQGLERFFHANAQLFAGAGALFQTGGVPGFQRAFPWRLAGVAEAAGVDQQPQE